VGGGCVARFAPDGSVDRVLDLPCTAPTSCAFGGEDLRTLFVTSARFGLPDDRRDHPDEGALFAVEPGVAGLAEHLFG
jgi:sugar lactone lactonase YvrE